MRLVPMPENTLTGNIQKHRGFRSRIFANRRDVLVYLPRGYRRFSRQRYPVLYLQDGQNVFDAATAFSHVEWGVDETAQQLIRKNLIEPIIIVAIANTGESVRISIRDRGPGIPEDFKPHIFEKFARADQSDSRKSGGTGLGLSIAKQIVDRLDGYVDFEDAIGGGTIFNVSLPRLKGCAQE